MLLPELHILPIILLDAFRAECRKDLREVFDGLKDAEVSTETFSFYTSVASVFSSKIEGEPIELDSYIRHRQFGTDFLPDYTKKIDDLYAAYLFAQEHPLDKEHLEAAHRLLSRHLLATHQQGQLRKQNMSVLTPAGSIEYIAATPFEVPGEMEKLYGDIERLLQAELSIEESFYFASMIHLVFVKIHPFNDGNGRTGRLLEKCFLAQKLGPKAWYVQSEKVYYQQHAVYYERIRALGLEYPALDYGQGLPFLMMLTEGIDRS